MNASFGKGGWVEQCSSMNLGLVKVLNEALSVPLWEYAALAALISVVLLYRALEFHFIGDLLAGLRGDPVKLVHSPVSRVAAQVLSKCQTLNRRYWPTIWLCSPHLQTAFVHFHGRPPKVAYRREIFVAPDGGSIALDWLEPAMAGGGGLEETPIVIIVPGLSSESFNPYLKHLAHGMSVKGWRAVVMNHRGLGGISVTCERFYHAGWTSDIRCFVEHLHKQFPKAHLLAVGASLGANMLVKYLGEEGVNTPLLGAASICNPWDLVVCDRFIARKPLQKLYDIAVATGLTDLVVRHETIISKMNNWNFIKKSRSIRMFDHFFTISVHKFETVDDYYRRSSSARYLGSVGVPLLAVSSLDDPLCTPEAIPWDESRINPNVLLAVTQHGGHLAYFEGLTAKNIWWVGALQEFFAALISSSPVHSVQEEPCPELPAVQPQDVVEEVVEEVESEGQDVEEEVENAAEDGATQEISKMETQTTPAAVESTIFMDDKGLNLQLCLKTREEMLALHSALARILGMKSQTDASPKVASPVISKQAVLLFAVPIVGAAIAIGLRRTSLRKRLRLFNCF